MNDIIEIEEESIYTPGYIFAPGSIHHGYKTTSFDKLTLAEIQINRQLEFIGWLFDNSDIVLLHTESEAWLIFDKEQLIKYNK